MSPTNSYRDALAKSVFTEASRHDVGYIAGALATLYILYLFGRVLYNLFLHPLSKFPGPKLAAASRIYHCYYLVDGSWPQKTRMLHEKYGDVVRVAPNQLSYATGDAFNEIYGHRPGRRELQKDFEFYISAGASLEGIITSSRDRHSVLRRNLSHGFSEKALREQESIMRMYADLCIKKLREQGNSGITPLNIVKWYNFFTFDVMGDLVFGEPFDCLSSSEYHPWVEILFDSIKLVAWIRAMMYIPILKLFLPFTIPKGLPTRRKNHLEMSTAKAEARLVRKDDRTDLIGGLMKPGSGITKDEFISTAQTLIVAGSETTATLLSGATYLLLINPNKLARLTKEVRETFPSADEINLVSINKLEYLLACLNEALRMYPPVPEALPRTTGEYPEMICGELIPSHTSIAVSQWSTFRSSKNFVEPDQFIPERWLNNIDDMTYQNDKRHALQPFSIGPRNCIGRNLAYAEMRIMLALVLWNFDLELMEVSKDWIDQKAYLLWEKKKLMVKLHPRTFEVVN